VYILLAIFLSFAALLVFNLAATATIAVVWKMLAARANDWSANRRTKVIFALRVFPLAGALIFVAAFLLPAYFLFEPYNAKETITYKLALPALVSAAGAVLALLRVAGKLWKTRRLIKGWRAGAEPVKIADLDVPVYRISHEFPLIAVVGVFSPTIFVARQIFDALGEAEFRAAVAHELGHIRARDNLRRMILGVCQDSLFVIAPFNRRLDRLWAETAEAAADEFAARTGAAEEDGAKTALNLAAALVKIARLAPSNARPATLAGASLLTEQTDDVTGRVRRLLRLSEGEFSRVKNFWSENSSKFYLVALPSVGLLAANRDFLQKIHHATESVVHILQ
jgi:Zn-dependent protease with chaperone function